jgi:hypothetical protein
MNTMIFQLLDFGPLSAKVQKYADLDGSIPTRGDRWQDFHWSRSIHRLFADQRTGEQSWQRFIQDASVATQGAIDKFEELQDTPPHG